MNELISVIVPVYNVEEYLDKCIKSILVQTYKNMEVILVDDGSTDKSGELCDRLALKDNRIKVYHKGNGGLSDARNFGIDRSHGKYLTFIDSDDIIAEDMVEELYGLLKENNGDISICDPVHIFSSNDYKFESGTKVQVFDNEEAIIEMLYQTSFLVSAWGKLYKKELFDNINFPKGILFEDIAIMYKLFFISKKIIYSNSKKYGYMHRENSITTKDFSIKDLDILKICDELIEFGRSHPVYQEAIRIYSINANLRIYLNAPQTYSNEIKKAETYIYNNKNEVLKDKRIRNKLKIALILFSVNKQLLRKVYPKINRWK